MFSKVTILSGLAFAVSALAQSFSLATPASLIQCQPVQIAWTGGNSPFILAAIPGMQTGAAAIETISSSVTSSPYVWTVNLASGTYLTLKITDSQGNIQYSSALTIQAGVSNSCINSTAVTSGVVTSAVTTTVSGSTTVSSAVMSSASSVSSAVTSATSSAASGVSSAANSLTSAAASAISSAATTSKASGASPVSFVGVSSVIIAVGGAAIGGIAMLI